MVVVHRSDELTDGLPTSSGACGSVYTVIVKLVRQTFHIFTHFHTRIVFGTQFPAIILLTASIGAVFHRTYPGSLRGLVRPPPAWAASAISVPSRDWRSEL